MFLELRMWKQGKEIMMSFELPYQTKDGELRKMDKIPCTLCGKEGGFVCAECAKKPPMDEFEKFRLYLHRKNHPVPNFGTYSGYDDHDLKKAWQEATKQERERIMNDLKGFIDERKLLATPSFMKEYIVDAQALLEWIKKESK